MAGMLKLRPKQETRGQGTAMNNDFHTALTSGQNRAVGALITYRVFPRAQDTDPKPSIPILDAAGKSETGPTSLSLFFELATKAERTLIVRRPWFGFDSCDLDVSVNAQVLSLQSGLKDMLSLYEGLEMNPGSSIEKMFRDLCGGDSESVSGIINDETPQYIEIDFKEEPDAAQAITYHVPFARLKSTLLRFSNALSITNRGFLDEVRIAQTPRFSNDCVDMNRVFSVEPIPRTAPSVSAPRS